MNILVNTRNEQEEKVILAFLDSLAVEYKTEFEEDEQISKNFIHEYNRLLDKADSEIENGNFVHQNDVEAFFDKRRQSI